ncbi:hypothetical protein GEMRC1_002856 [Eukaryota sp. GEM-RC1]
MSRFFFRNNKNKNNANDFGLALEDDFSGLATTPEKTRSASSTDQTPTHLLLLSSKYSDTLVHVIPIPWHTSVRNDLEATLKPLRVPLSNPPKNILFWRNISENQALDVVLWQTKEFRQRIVSHVCLQLMTEYTSFLHTFPKFSGSVSLFGHSLGAIISHYILSRQGNLTTPITDLVPMNGNVYALVEQLLSDGVTPVIKPSSKEDPIHVPQLSFPVDTFFTCGSALSVMLHLEGDLVPGKSLRIPLTRNWFCLCNALDVLAYRIEPTFHRSFFESMPVQCFKTVTRLNSLRQRTRGFFRKSSVQEELVSLDLSDANDALQDAETVDELLMSSEEEEIDYAAALDLGISDFQDKPPTTASPKVLVQPKFDQVSEVCFGARYDYVIDAKGSSVSLLSGVKAHIKYWSDRDAGVFLAECLLLV